jgi:simple sugar transport system permease protein
MAFVFMGLGAGLAGVFSTMINFTWWPTAGEGYLLPTLAAVFRGRHADLGRHRHGRGRRAGRADRVLHPDRHRRSGLSGFYVQFFNGLIIILSLLGHRWNQVRYR